MSIVCALFLGLFFCYPLGAQNLKIFEQELSQIYDLSKQYAVTITVSAIPTTRSNYITPGNNGSYEIAVGSGFIFDSLGHIVTTSSVTEEGNLFKIIFSDGTSMFADLVGTDLEHNISVLKTSARLFQAPRFADSDKLTPGLWIGVISNSFGVFPAFAYGFMAGTNDSDEILVTADLSPGSAGGMVINSDGFVVGMIAYKLTEPTELTSIRFGDVASQKALLFTSGEVELPVGGYSLVIPANRVVERARDIISGRIKHGGFLGIYPEDLDMDWAKRVFNISHGVYIANVLKDSPAFRAGVREGDILLTYNGYRIRSSNQLRRLILNGLPGAEVDISILRGGRIKTLKTTLGQYKTIFPDKTSGEYESGTNESSNPASKSRNKTEQPSQAR